MSKQVIVGKLLRDLQKKIQESYEKGVVVKVMAVIVSVTEPDKKPKSVTLVVHEKKPT